MPEGDTVWLASRRLHDALAGCRVTRSDFRVPALATADLTGRTVTEVVPRGKHLLMRFDDDLTLHSHLRMDGSWHLYRHGERWHGGPNFEVRVLLETADRQAVGYRLHDLALLPRAEEATLIGHLGPDLLGPDWDLDEAVRRLCADPHRAIGPALLDQRSLAGIGNMYKAEALFLHGVSPWAQVGAVPDLPRLVERARRLLLANRDRPAQVTTGDPRRGREHWVFERSGKPCRRCGTTVRAAEQGSVGGTGRGSVREAATYQRLSYWCPRCQPAP